MKGLNIDDKATHSVKDGALGYVVDVLPSGGPNAGLYVYILDLVPIKRCAGKKQYKKVDIEKSDFFKT